jgi:hypothetical protein
MWKAGMKLIRMFWRNVRDEAGVVTAEYVAVTATAVVVAITIAWVTFSDVLAEAIGVVSSELLAFIEEKFP